MAGRQQLDCVPHTGVADHCLVSFDGAAPSQLHACGPAAAVEGDGLHVAVEVQLAPKLFQAPVKQRRRVEVAIENNRRWAVLSTNTESTIMASGSRGVCVCACLAWLNHGKQARLCAVEQQHARSALWTYVALGGGVTNQAQAGQLTCQPPSPMHPSSQGVDFGPSPKTP